MDTETIRLYNKDLEYPGSLEYEWLETNGLGGYAMGTPLFANTRKYHSLLACDPGGLGRHSFLSKVDVEIEIEGTTYELGTNFFPGAVHPEGFLFATEFAIEDFPTTLFRVGNAMVRLSAIMPEGENSILLRCDCDRELSSLCLKPFLSYRDIHGLSRENASADLSFRTFQDGVLVSPYDGMPPLFFSLSRESTVSRSPDWYRSFEYSCEKARGYEYHEDLISPGVLRVEPEVDKPTILMATLEQPEPDLDLERIWDLEVEGRQNNRRYLADRFPSSKETSTVRSRFVQLGIGAGHFIIGAERDSSPSVIAGFPWFGEWGRDSMIALEGLTLSLGRYDEARSILETYARHERNGLFPNQLAHDGNSSYNTIDASLWFFEAANRYLVYTQKELNEVPVIRRTMKRILKAFFRDAVPMARIVDGFLDVGSVETQLTWMDAEVNGKPVTPRQGLPVEINALWYNALSIWSDRSNGADEKLISRVGSVLDRFEERFIVKFWIDKEYLADVVSATGAINSSIRPNQIFALSLSHTPIDSAKANLILDAVETHLLTPYGLRTLSPSQSGYVGRYEGSQESRDLAYHQGTVWPWLVGHYFSAMNRFSRGDRGRIERVAATLAPLFESIAKGPGLLGISEIYDGDPPHRAAGCPAQAWSVAEVLRSLLIVEQID